MSPYLSTLQQPWEQRYPILPVYVLYRTATGIIAIDLPERPEKYPFSLSMFNPSPRSFPPKQNKTKQKQKTNKQENEKKSKQQQKERKENDFRKKIEKTDH